MEPLTKNAQEKFWEEYLLYQELWLKHCDKYDEKFALSATELWPKTKLIKELETNGRSSELWQTLI